MARRTGWRVCSKPGCPEFTDQGGRCEGCRAEAERTRGTAKQRGYGGTRWRTARRTVLDRDPRCVCTDTEHGHNGQCPEPSTVADHYPDERRDLIAAGATDPDAPHRMRGVCSRCHNRKTAVETPGGFRA